MSETEVSGESPFSAKQSPVSLAINVLTAPSAAFSVIKKKPTSLFPLAVVILSTLLVTGWYFTVLDFDWYIDDTLSQLSDRSEAELEEIREGMEFLSPNNMRWITLLTSGLSLMMIYLLQASYLSLTAALRGDEIRFKQWWALVAWSNLPAVLLALSMAVNILLNPSGQISIVDLNGLSLLALGMETADPSINRILATVNLPTIWTLVLLVIGYRLWLQAGLARSVSIIFTPYLLIYGVWTFFAVS
jgi:hypothetical protein